MKKGVTLKPIKPNWALGNAYRIKLLKLTKLMLADIIETVEKTYSKAEPEINQILEDSSSITNIYRKITLKIKKWESFFCKISIKLSNKFIDDVHTDVTNKIVKSLEPVKNFIHIAFNEYDKQILNANQALIQENVNLIKDIPVELKKQIQMHVSQAISRGRDKKYLSNQLKEIGTFTVNRVKTITRDQINKATSAINHASQASLGITKQEWVYTGISKKPRQSHVQAAGKIYSIDKGCLIDGEYIYPGEKINCACISAPYIEFDLK